MVEASKALKGEVRPRVGGADAVPAAAPDNKATGGRANDRSDLVAGDDFVIGVVNVGVVPTGGVANDQIARAVHGDASAIVGDVVALDVVEAVAIGHDARPRVAGAVVVRHAAPPAGLDPSVRVAVGRAAADRGAAGTDPVRAAERRAAANRAATRDIDPVARVAIGRAAADRAALAGTNPGAVEFCGASADRAASGDIDPKVGVVPRRAEADRAAGGKDPVIAVAFCCAITDQAPRAGPQAAAIVVSEAQILILSTFCIKRTHPVTAPIPYRSVAHSQVANGDTSEHAAQGAGYADQGVAGQVNGDIARGHRNAVVATDARQRTG